jgi:hypothetical protein
MAWRFREQGVRRRVFATVSQDDVNPRSARKLSGSVQCLDGARVRQQSLRVRPGAALAGDSHQLDFAPGAGESRRLNNRFARRAASVDSAQDPAEYRCPLHAGRKCRLGGLHETKVRPPH